VRKTNDVTDLRIIALLQKRDEAALSLLEQTYGALCRSVACEMLGSREDAEECVNDALMKLWESVPPLKPDCLRAYFVTLTRRAAISRYRSLTAQRRGGRTGGQFAEALDELSDTLVSSEQVEQQVEQRQLQAAIERFLASLPPQQRTVFMQRYWLSDPVKTVAKSHGMSIGKVKMMLMRTRRKLQAFLQEEGLL